MGLFSSVRANLRDVHRFGIAVLLRHIASGRTFAIRVRGFGTVHMRRDNLDLDLARIVLVDGAYDYPWPLAAAQRLRNRYESTIAAGQKPVIVNAGGYIGFSALWFARQWPKAEIISIEPDPGNLQLLHRNLAGRPRQTIIEAAVGSAAGRAALSADSEGCAVQTKRSNDGVDIVTIDDAVARVSDGEPFICNIDIEGFEKDLFAANTDWIDRFALVIIEPHDWRDPGAMISRNFQREMAARPFEIYPRRDALYYLHA
jgi:FkbM family methyltransferase